MNAQAEGAADRLHGALVSLRGATETTRRRMRAFRSRLHAALRAYRGDAVIDLRSDDEFLRDAYRETLGRDPDESGRENFLQQLHAGASRDVVLLRLATSEESINRRLAARSSIQNLVELRPDAFSEVATLNGSQRIRVFEVRSDADLDWMEHAILEYGYYEKPGIWTLGIDEDKRRMAQLLALFAPDRSLEIGCSSGAVVTCLHDSGIDAHGVDISTMAVERAAPHIRNRIHVGDVLELELPGPFQLVYGLDIFEHFNPNRIDAYIRRVVELTAHDGFVFANVPTWGADPVYGTIWEPYLQSWVEDLALNRLFRQIEVDADGYPLHGHLIWAGSSWWQERFCAAGLQRHPEIEGALHARFDHLFDDTPARKAFYVFSRDAPSERVSDILRRCNDAA